MDFALVAGIAAVIFGVFGITVFAKNRKIAQMEKDNRQMAYDKAKAEIEAIKESQRADAADAGKDLNTSIAKAVIGSQKESYKGTGSELSEEDRKNAENIMSRDISD